MKNNYLLLALLAFVAYKFLKPKPVDTIGPPVDRLPEDSRV